MKSLSTAYMARKFAKGGKVKSMSQAPAIAPETEMCAHGGEAMCNEGCYSEGGMENPKLEESHMSEGGDVSLEADEEMGIGPSGDEDDDSRAEKFAKGGMMKSRILGKILGGISKMHRGM